MASKDCSHLRLRGLAQKLRPITGRRHTEYEEYLRRDPGTKYGWPKNVLHWNSIHRSILDISGTRPIHLVVADGVMAMEGNVPLHGTHRHLGKIVLSDDPVAADFTCARLMGLDPNCVWHLNRAAHFLGNGSNHRMDLIAEALPAWKIPFNVLPEFTYLQTRL